MKAKILKSNNPIPESIWGGIREPWMCGRREKIKSKLDENC